MTSRIPRAFVVALCLMAPFSALAQGETAPPPTQPFWAVTCSNQQTRDSLLCELSQSIMRSENNQRIATASFTRVAGQPETRAFFLLPLGGILTEGISVAVDDTPAGTLTYQSCDLQGCYATGAVDDAWLSAMKSGNRLTVGIRSRDGQDIKLEFQLGGFAKAEAILP